MYYKYTSNIPSSNKMYTSYNKLRKSSCDIMPHRKQRLCVMLYRLILSYIRYKIV